MSACAPGPGDPAHAEKPVVEVVQQEEAHNEVLHRKPGRYAAHRNPHFLLSTILPHGAVADSQADASIIGILCLHSSSPVTNPS